MSKDNKTVWVKKTVCTECDGSYPDHKEGCSFRGKDGWTITGGVHGGCGGNIITRGSCRKCDKCDEHFCGCAAG